MLERLGWLRALGLGLFLSGCARDTVVHNQIERDANEIKLRLLDAGLDATIATNHNSRDLKFNVQVPRESFRAAIKVLYDFGLPRLLAVGSVGLVSGNKALIPTAQGELMRQIVALQGDVSTGLELVPRVVKAHALVSVPVPHPLREMNEARPKAKIAVLVVYQADEQGNAPLSTQEIQRFAQAALIDAQPASVFVLMVPTHTPPPPDETPAPRIPRDACRKDSLFGLEVCARSRSSLLNLLIGAVSVGGVLAGAAVVAVLRALRYRSEITRLTAQYRKRS